MTFIPSFTLKQKLFQNDQGPKCKKWNYKTPEENKQEKYVWCGVMEFSDMIPEAGSRKENW